VGKKKKDTTMVFLSKVPMKGGLSSPGRIEIQSEGGKKKQISARSEGYLFYC